MHLVFEALRDDLQVHVGSFLHVTSIVDAQWKASLYLKIIVLEMGPSP